MSTVNFNSKKLLEEGLGSGLISKQAFDVAMKCNLPLIDKALSVDDSALDATEFDLLFMSIDDSGSVSQLKDPQTQAVIGPDQICKGQGLVIDAFLNSKKGDHEGVLVLTWLLNSPHPVQPLTRLIDPAVTRLANGVDYRADGGTPLYDQAAMLMTSALVFKVWARQQKQAGCKGSMLLVTDGADQHSHKCNTQDVNILVEELAGGSKEKPEIGVGMIGIENQAETGVDFREIAHQMGIPDSRIFLTDSAPKNVRNAFFKFSQSADATQ